MRVFPEDRLEAPPVELTAARLEQTRDAFDGVAATYDGANRANALIAAMRAHTLAAVTSRLPADARLLDLGCGPGADAVALAERGHRVVATDWSPAMAAAARERASRSSCCNRIEVLHLGIHDVGRLRGRIFDGVYSDLGPLNCVPDLCAAARTLATLLRPGGLFVASVIGRVCPWEVARYGLAGRWHRASVRFARGFVPVPLEGRTVWMRYYDPDEFDRVFVDAGFRRVARRALGLLTPPPYLDAFASRHPRAIDRLRRLEDTVAAWPGVNRLGDHFLTVLARR
jgi:SAM-dependent methyltransferase